MYFESNDGLGIINLTCQNEALLAKWIWHIQSGQEGIWAKTMRSLYGVTMAAHLGQRRSNASFFIGDLIPIISFCAMSTEMIREAAV